MVSHCCQFHMSFFEFGYTVIPLVVGWCKELSAAEKSKLKEAVEKVEAIRPT